jgi:hypothetical protein
LLRHFTVILVVLNFSNCGFLYTMCSLCPFVGRLAKPSGRIPVMERIALFW